MVDLSELRLRAWAVGRDRRDYAFDLHAGIRGPQAAVRLAAREIAGTIEAASVRIRAAQSELHATLEAGVDRTGSGWPRRRLGRSTDADHRRIEAARRPARGDPGIRQAYRRGKGQQRCRRRNAGILHP